MNLQKIFGLKRTLKINPLLFLTLVHIYKVYDIKTLNAHFYTVCEYKYQLTHDS